MLYSSCNKVNVLDGQPSSAPYLCSRCIFEAGHLDIVIALLAAAEHRGSAAPLALLLCRRRLEIIIVVVIVLPVGRRAKITERRTLMWEW